MKRSPERRGAVLVAAMVAMLVATSLVATMLAGALAARKECRVERGARQAALLVEAGRDKALAAWRANDTYTGETWQATLSDSPQPQQATVTIQLQPRSEGVQAVVAVFYAPEGGLPIRRSQSFVLARPSTDPSVSEE